MTCLGTAGAESQMSPAERRLVDGINRLMPHYQFDLSYFAKNRRKSDSITARASPSSSETPADSRSDKTE